jgi:hypothetical protein
MDRRQAKRHAARHLGAVAARQAEVIEHRYKSGGIWDGLSRADAIRVTLALFDLADELNRRGASGKVRAKVLIPVHPDQTTLVFEEW